MVKFVRSFVIAALVCAVVAATSERMNGDEGSVQPDGLDFEAQQPSLVDKRQLKKLRPHNPILIFHQSIRQPGGYFFPLGNHYQARTGRNEDPSTKPTSVDNDGKQEHAARRLVRQKSEQNVIDQLPLAAPLERKVMPMFVWNHQLLPNFYNKRQPIHILRLRQEAQAAAKTKRSGIEWVDSPYIATEDDYEEQPLHGPNIAEDDEDE